MSEIQTYEVMHNLRGWQMKVPPAIRQKQSTNVTEQDFF